MSKKAVGYLVFALLVLIIVLAAIIVAWVLDPTGELSGLIGVISLIVVCFIGLGIMGAEA